MRTNQSYVDRDCWKCRSSSPDRLDTRLWRVCRVRRALHTYLAQIVYWQRYRSWSRDCVCELRSQPSWAPPPRLSGFPCPRPAAGESGFRDAGRCLLAACGRVCAVISTCCARGKPDEHCGVSFFPSCTPFFRLPVFAFALLFFIRSFFACAWLCAEMKGRAPNRHMMPRNAASMAVFVVREGAPRLCSRTVGESTYRRYLRVRGGGPGERR